MTHSHLSGAETPFVAAADLFGELAEATQAAALAALKVEMEGLAVLFGGTSAPKSEALQRADEAETEGSFDNMPV